MTTYRCKNLRIFAEVKPEPQMTKDLISRADAIAILEDEMPGHYLSKKTQIVAKLRALPAMEVGVTPECGHPFCGDRCGTATTAADVAGLVDWIDKNSARLGQVQGFAYGEDGLLFTVRDCWPKENQTVWQKQSSAESQRADHADMIRQIDIYRMSLAFAALARMKEAKE